MFPKPSLKSSPQRNLPRYTLRGWIHVSEIRLEIIVFRICLSKHEMSMMGMTQIGVQVIIIRKNFNKKYYASQNKIKKFPDKDDCRMLLIHLYSQGIQNEQLCNLCLCFLFNKAQNVMQHICPDTNTTHILPLSRH